MSRRFIDFLSGILIAMSILVAVQPVAAQTANVYHSPDDSGLAVGVVELAPGTTETLHLYLDNGSVASGGPDPCCAGQGDEVLGWNLQFAGSGGLMIDQVAASGDVVVNDSPTLLRMTGGNFQTGDLGPTKLADVDVTTVAGGAFQLVYGETLGATLARNAIVPTTVATVPEPGIGFMAGAGCAALVALARRRRPHRHHAGGRGPA